MILWIIFAVLTAAALTAVLWPVLRMGHLNIERAAFDSEVFKDQLQELSSEEDRGVISSEEAEAARTEVSRRLLSAAKTEADISSKMSARQNSIPTLALVCAFICVPVVSVSLYIIYGSPELPDKPLIARLDQNTKGQNVQVLIAKVEARLRQDPEDGRGWEVLAPVYMRQQRFRDAADAFGKAIRLLGETSERLVDYGNALVFSNEGVVTEPARKAFQKAVEKDADLSQAHFWLAVAQEQDGSLEQAAAAWRSLLKRGGADAPWRRTVQQRLADLERQLGTGKPGKTVESTNRTAAKGPDRDQMEAAKSMSQSDRSAMVRQMVSGLAERLKSNGGSVDEWKKLVRSYAVLGDKEAAVAAISDARKAVAQDAGAIASLNEMAREFGLSDEQKQKPDAPNSSITSNNTNDKMSKGPSVEQIEDSKNMDPSDRSAMIKQMVEGLAERLRSNGGSVDEWKKLVRSYAVLGDKEATARAIDDARKDMGSDAQAIAAINEMARKLGL